MELFHPKKTIYTTFEFTDIAGLVKGASKGEGLGNQFLSNIRLTDAICHVVRCFDDADITHVEGSVDPIRDIEIINLELIMADLQTIENRLSKVERKAVTNKDKDALAEVVVLKKLKEALEAGKPARSVELDKDELLLIKAFSLLTIKPMIYIANMSDEEIVDPDANPYFQKVKELAELEPVSYTYLDVYKRQLLLISHHPYRYSRQCRMHAYKYNHEHKKKPTE